MPTDKPTLKMKIFFNKKEILEGIKADIDARLAGLTTSKLPSSYNMANIRIMQELLAKVEDLEFLPLPKNCGWNYIVYADEYGAKVELMYGYNKDGKIKLQRICFAEVKARMLASEEYGKDYNASAGLIRQWIRRGKLPNAQKYGALWRISELAVPEGRGYKFRIYTWNRAECVFENELAFLNTYDAVSLEQCKDGRFAIIPRTNHACGMLVNAYPLSEKPQQEAIFMTQKEKEALELKLIEHPFTKHQTCSAFLEVE